MLDPVVEMNGNEAVLKFVPYLKPEVCVKAAKTSSQHFRLSYTALHETTQFSATVEQVDDCGVFVRDQFGRLYNVSKLSVDEKLEVNDTVLVFDEYGILFDVFNDRRGPRLVATKIKIADPRLIAVNLDILNSGGEIVVRYRCSPYTGDSIQVTQ